MRRGFLIALLSFGTVAGYGSALCHGSCHARSRRAMYEDHIASVCVNAARRAQAEDRPAARAPVEKAPQPAPSIEEDVP